MSEMVERVARAMHQRALDEGWSGPPWEQMPSDQYWQALGLARAAIEAMREPTEEMVEVGLDSGHIGGDMGRGDLRFGWETMIDAALKLSPTA